MIVFDAKRYEKDLKRMKRSGLQSIKKGEKSLNRQVVALIKDVLPIQDVNKISDVDLVYGFLITTGWNVQKAAQKICEYACFRSEHQVDKILKEKYDPVLVEMMPRCIARDLEGTPVFYDLLDPEKFCSIWPTRTEKEITRYHIHCFERYRGVCKALERDRIVYMFNIANLNWNFIRNRVVLSFYKSFIRISNIYPEIIVHALVTEAGRLFQIGFSMIKPLLSEFSKQKVIVCATSDSEEVQQVIDSNTITDEEPADILQILDNLRTQEDHQPRSTSPVQNVLTHSSSELVSVDGKHDSTDEESGSLETCDSTDSDLSSSSLDKNFDPDDDMKRLGLDSDLMSVVGMCSSTLLNTKGRFQRIYLDPFKRRTGKIALSARIEGMLVAEIHGSHVLFPLLPDSKIDGKTYLMAEMFPETGHYIHRHVLVCDVHRHVRFVAKARSWYRDVIVNVPDRPCATLEDVGHFQLRCSTATNYFMTAYLSNNPDQKWFAFRSDDPNTTLITRGQNYVDIGGLMSTLPVGVLLALVTSIDDLW